MYYMYAYIAIACYSAISLIDVQDQGGDVLGVLQRGLVHQPGLLLAGHEAVPDALEVVSRHVVEVLSPPKTPSH